MAVFGVGQHPALAADNGSWSVEPGGRSGPGARTVFNYSLKPGQSFQDTVTIANLSDKELTLDLYGTDAYNTSLDGGFALLPDSESPVDAGSWIRLATDQITLQPQTQAEVPFEISIPVDATPGDHAAGIVAQNVDFESELDANGVGVQVRRRVASRVYVRVDGPLEPQLQVTRVAVEHSAGLVSPITDEGNAVISYEIENTGNTRLIPTTTLTVEGLFGREIIGFEPRLLKELLPGSSVIVTESFTGTPPLDRLTAKVKVEGRDARGQVVADATGSTTFWVISWPFVVSLLLIIPLIWLLRRERRRPPSAPKSAPPARELVDA